MIATVNQKILPCLLSSLLVVATMPQASAMMMYQDQQAASPPASSSYPGQGAPMTAQELQSLVAPIALYPDALVAQILSAATFPDQVAVANNWLEQNKNLTGTALGQAVNGQSWDPSVKALTQFPSVLNNMSQNLAWTSQLGEAYHNQSADVMTAVQTLRAQAKAAGNLKSGSQITVVQQTPQTIVIQPANPQIVYVPEYNPTVVYGTPYVVPGYSTGDMVAASVLSFGAGIAVGAMMSGGCCGWGYSSWNCNWYHGGGVYYGNHPYYGNNAWHGGYYNNGYHPYNNGYNSSGYHPNTNYNKGYNSSGYHANNYSHNTNVSGNTVNVNRGDTTASNSMDKSGWGNSDAARGWGSQDTGSKATAFSGYGDHSGSSSGSGGWADRSASSRGWGSRGGGGGWGGGGGHFGGGGGFHGGGGRR
jgi:uncharacterized membrane protein YgcG